jgi:hypothetical protein
MMYFTLKNCAFTFFFGLIAFGCVEIFRIEDAHINRYHERLANEGAFKQAIEEAAIAELHDQILQTYCFGVQNTDKLFPPAQIVATVHNETHYYIRTWFMQSAFTNMLIKVNSFTVTSKLSTKNALLRVIQLNIPHGIFFST